MGGGVRSGVELVVLGKVRSSDTFVLMSGEQLICLWDKSWRIDCKIDMVGSVVLTGSSAPQLLHV